jgi:2-(1,2-epoxy-1,2-dihydrophenyl)acetyl-CoA isomerase
MSEALVLYEILGDVAVLRLNAPGTLNACSDAMCALLIEKLSLAQKQARAIVLTGVGRGFCSGADLGVSAANTPAAERDAGGRLERLFNPLLTLIRELTIPLVTAVNGPAAGAGCSIGLAGDLVIAAESAYFLQAFSRIGLIPDAGSAYLLAKSAGRVRAMEAMLLAEKISASQALSWGLINRVTPDGEAFDVALELATRLASGPTFALGLVRRLCWFALEERFQDQMALERQLQRLAGQNPDFEEGVAAFMEKRPTCFSGASNPVES